MSQVAYLAQKYVMERLTDGSTGFNSAMRQSASVYGVTPFSLSTDFPNPTLILGRFTPADLKKALGMGSTLNFPYAILSVGKADSMGQQSLKILSSVFSGAVTISVDFYVNAGNSSLPVDGNAMWHAVADSFYTALNSSAAYSSIPQGIVYNNEAMVEQGLMEWDGSRWVQFIPCSVKFISVTG